MRQLQFQFQPKTQWDLPDPAEGYLFESEGSPMIFRKLRLHGLS
jgi:hypothetical protein